MGDYKRMKRRYKKLWERQSGKCFWCGEQMVEYHRPGKCPALAATIDHQNSRYSRARKNPKRKEATVLSCYRCNNDRAREETKSKSKFFLWVRSGRFPRTWWGRVLKIIFNIKRIY